MIEKISKMINPSAVDLLGAAGGTPEIQGNEILLGFVGCDNAYSSIIIANIHFEKNNDNYLNTVTLSQRKKVINDCIKHYRIYLHDTKQKPKIHTNTMCYIANTAIDAKIKNYESDDKKLLKEMQKFDYRISKYKYDTKYKEIINQCFSCISNNIRIAMQKMAKKLGK